MKRKFVFPGHEGHHARPFDVKAAIRQRRERRMERNLSLEDQTREEAGKLGYHLSVHNDGHHWVFRDGSGRVAEWWPSSAKLVLNRDYGRCIHAHDWPQVLAELHNLPAEQPNLFSE